MHIGTFLKQVPRTLKTGADGLMDRSGASMINPYCRHALEEAIKLKMAVFRTGRIADLSVISMGPPNFEQSLRQAISMGADNIYLLSDRRLAGSDTMATAKALARLVQTIEKERGWKFDVLFAGLQTIDGDTAHVGPQVAERLGYEQVTYVEKVEYLPETNRLNVRRIIEKGYMVVDTPLPVLLSVTNVANIPRGPTLAGLMKARGSKIIRFKKIDLNLRNVDNLGFAADEIGLAGSPTVVAEVRVVEATRPPVRVAAGSSGRELVDNMISLMESR